MAENKSSIPSVAAFAKERAIKSLSLRAAGASFHQIAEQIGYKNASLAFNAVKAALQKAEQESVDECRKLENERLDRLLLTYWQRALGGDYTAAKMVLSIHKARVKLNLPSNHVLVPVPHSVMAGINVNQILAELDNWDRQQEVRMIGGIVEDASTDVSVEQG